MKEELVSFEVAELAKEKGFDEKCIYYYFDYFGKGILNPNSIRIDLKSSYYRGGKILERNEGVIKTEELLMLEGIYNNYNEESKDMYSAPTQSLLQKWLRDVHNIHLRILDPKLKPDKWICHFTTLYSFISPRRFGVSGNTYEETLEAGLKEALLLI